MVKVGETQGQSQEAAGTPSQCLYLADPHRIAVLGIKIIAQASSETLAPTLSSTEAATQPRCDVLPSPLKASTSSTASTAPPSSYKSPTQSHASTSAAPPFSQVNGGRSRPRSVELGARAKEAFLDLGRGMTNGLRNLSKTDITDTSEGSHQSTRTLDDKFVRGGSKSNDPSPRVAGVALHETRVSRGAEQQERHARQVYSLRPHSLTFGGPGPSAQLTSTAVNLHYSSRIEASLPLPTLDSTKPHWERLGSTQTEFAMDEEAQQSNTLIAADRAGVFSVMQRADMGSEASDDDDEESDDGDSDGDFASSDQWPAVVDPLRLLLKVSPPIDYLRQQGTDPARESTGVFIKARLRLGAGSLAAPPSPPRPRLSPAGPRTPRMSGQASKASRIVFISACSSKKLLDAVDSTRMRHRDGAKFSGPLASAEAARLEGIEWLPVEGERPSSEVINFEWKWKELGRGSTIRKNVLGEEKIKCAWAFIELSEELCMVRILTFYCFLIHLPASREGAPMIKGSPAVPADDHLEARWKRNSAASPRISFPSELLQPPARGGVGLGLVSYESDARALDFPEMATTPTGNRHALRNRRFSTDTGSPHARNRLLSSDAKDSFDLALQPAPLQVDYSEITLADVEEDGPILRAALANLERRTTSLKRAAKELLKAAADVRTTLQQLRASEEVLNQSLDHFALLSPCTMGHLNHSLLAPKRREMDRFREQEREMLEAHVETPLRAVVEMCRVAQDQSKNFESESKVYYAATQKWLSSRASFPGSSSGSSKAEPMDQYSSTAVGFDKASLKQERMDDKQRLRQARFHLARLDIFRAANGVHGGETELQLANHVLALCRWQCVEEPAKRATRRFEGVVQTQLAKVREQGEAIRVKCGEVERQVQELQVVLGKGGGWDGEGEAGVSTNSEAEHTIGAATRQAGFKIKSILTSIGTNKQTQSATIPPVPSWDSGLETEESPTKAVTTTGVRKKASLKATTAPQSAPLLGGVPSFAKLQQRFRPSSYATPEGHGHGGAADLQDANEPRPDSTTSSGAVETGMGLAQQSPGPRRSVSVSGGVSPRIRVDHSFRGPSNPTMNRQSSNGAKSRASSDSQRPTAIVSTSLGGQQQAVAPTRTAMLQPRRAAQQSRKKEGILWAMSKPIAGSGGSDAPRAVSRSQNWRECWVVLSGSGHLGEYADWKDVKIMEPSQPLIDLRFATVREARGVERRFTFEVVTRDCRRFFQASHELEMKEWMGAIGLAIESLLNGTSSIRQIEKVARVAGGVSPFLGGGDEFGYQGNATAEAGPAALGQDRAFSQSLTDLSSATGGGPARLFHRGGSAVRDEQGRKRDAKGNAILSAHLSTLSEGGGGPAAASTNSGDFPSSPLRSTPWSHHERGISNKTPVSGYISQHQDSSSEARPSLSRSSSAAESDYDRRIEEMIHSSYGGSSSNHHRSSSVLSTGAAVLPASRHGVIPSGGSAFDELEEGGGGGNSAIGDKYSRSKEILQVAARPENGYCADCRSAEAPKWASWSLNGEPRCIFICIACSGVHRSLGVSISRVKSVELDDWTEEQLDSARQWGNDRVNGLYEAHKPEGVTVDSFGEGRSKQFWMEKYAKKAWFGIPHPTPRTSEQGQRRRSSDALDDMDEMEAIQDPASDIDERWDGTTPVDTNRLARESSGSSSSKSSSTTTGLHRWPRSSSSPPPGVEVQRGGKSKPGLGGMQIQNQASLDGSLPSPQPPSSSLPPSSPPARFPRRSIEQRSQPSSRFSPSLAA